jgi:hypothetical protein
MKTLNCLHKENTLYPNILMKVTEMLNGPAELGQVFNAKEMLSLCCLTGLGAT